MSNDEESCSADKPALEKWQAAPHHWDALDQAGSERGWKLAALSFGYAPVARVIDSLPDEEQKRELANRRRLINRHFAYPKDGELQRALVQLHDSAIECYYEVAGFVRWIESLAEVASYPNTVDPQMTQIAKRWADGPAGSEEVGAESSVPSKQQTAGITRIETSLLLALLGMAMRHYEYVPGSAQPGNMKDVYDRMSKDLTAYDLDVSADIFKKRLINAFDRLSEDEQYKLEEKLAKT